jgi:hypothetical protein
MITSCRADPEFNPEDTGLFLRSATAARNVNPAAIPRYLCTPTTFLLWDTNNYPTLLLGVFYGQRSFLRTRSRVCKINTFQCELHLKPR